MRQTRKIKRAMRGGGGLFVIGVAGASGCGKTYFSNLVKESLTAAGVDGIEVISCDNYYRPYPGGRKAPEDFNWDVPESLDLDLLEEHLKTLKVGGRVEIPKYDFLTSQRGVAPDRVIDGSVTRLVIVEGLFVLLNPSLRAEMNLKLFAWLEPDICLARRLVRDFKERGKAYEETIHQYQTQVKPAYVNFIEPTKKYADLIISTSEYSNTGISLDVIRSYVAEKLA